MAIDRPLASKVLFGGRREECHKTGGGDTSWAAECADTCSPFVSTKFLESKLLAERELISGVSSIEH